MVNINIPMLNIQGLPKIVVELELKTESTKTIPVKIPETKYRFFLNIDFGLKIYRIIN